MPKSNPVQDPDAEDRARRARRDDVKRRLGWAMVILGVALFLMGQIGARTGFVLLPFDQHHVLSQVAGFFLAIQGLIWGWR